MVKKINGPAPGDVTDVHEKTAPAAAGAAVLDGLAAEAAGLEGDAAVEACQAQEKQDKQAVDTLAADLADALKMAATVAQPALWWLTPEQFESLWGKSVQKAMAESGAEIMRRHGLSMGDVLSKYGPYIGLAGALGPSTLATVAAFKQAKQRMLEQQRAQGGGGDGSAT